MRKSFLSLSAFFVMPVLAACPGPSHNTATTVHESPQATEQDKELAKTLKDAKSSIEDPELGTLLTEHWAWTLQLNPLEATRLGVHHFDHKLAARGPDAEQAIIEKRAFFLDWAHRLQSKNLSDRDRESLDILEETLLAAQQSQICSFSTWNLSPRDNPITQWNALDQLHPLEHPSDGQAFLARLHAVPEVIESELASLALGAAAGNFANAESTRRILTMVHKQLDQELDSWPIIQAGQKETVSQWPKEQSSDFRKRLHLVVTDKIKPAFILYKDFLEQKILPYARDNSSPGLKSLPMATACYQARIRTHTGLQLSAEDIHQIGLEQIEILDQKFRVLGKTLFATDDLEQILRTLRTDPSLYFKDAKEVQAAAQSALDDARKSMPDFFGTLPRAPCVVTPMPAYEAPFSTIAYYTSAHSDGSKPGEYVINLYAPTTRPRFEARVLALHEAIPGHHLQIAIAQELPALPAFRKHGGSTFFIEGWALYTESLGDEMGLYSDDLDRMGMISFDAWRASRLVVDTGLHSMGWSREQAVQFMMEHTALAPNNIHNEVDRYIVWPGQALAYKLGQLEILRLRKHAEETLGSDFDLKDFHDALLGSGALPPALMHTHIEHYLTQAQP